MPKILDDRLAGIDSGAPVGSEELAREQAVKQIEARRRFKISTAAGRRTVLLMVLAMAALALAGCASPRPGAPSPAGAGTVARQLARSGATSVIVFVSDHGHSTVATAGTPPPAAGQRFRIGSVTKTFTATLVLQLVDQKRIGLDDPVGRYLPGVIPAGGTITIRELLQHRSGLANYTDYSSWMDQAEPSPSIRPIDALRFAASRPLLFAPGSQWAYSNTNYIALGLVIEKVTGRPFGQELQQRILKPLALSRTELATTRQLRDLDDPGTNPNLPWAAGGIVSDTQDLARFFSALLSGHLVSRASLANMKQAVAAGPSEDGLGIFATSLPCGRFWGHNGGILDYGTLVDASGNGARIGVISVRGPIGQPPDDSALLCPSSPRNTS
jgi:D-alanyl-D-alanine carboxypeptidase